MRPAPYISVVVPILDEAENLPVLHAELSRALGSSGHAYEVLYIDDGSSDGSLEVLRGLWHADRHVRVVQFKRNAGQTPAMAAGFDHSRGEVVVTLDGDLQNDPADIPRLVARLEEGFDVVAGWRKARQDGFVLRRLPSILANRLIRRVTGVRIHDTGCTLKAFRRRVVVNMPIYAEQHRFLPAMSASGGALVTELVVNHRPRRFGRSKYGISRALRVFLDLFTIKLISTFRHRPLQYFALLAAPFALLAALPIINGFLGVGPEAEDARGPALVISCLLPTTACVYFLLLGLLAELVVKAGVPEGGAAILAHRSDE